jgi:hypothetical protein
MPSHRTGLRFSRERKSSLQRQGLKIRLAPRQRPVRRLREAGKSAHSAVIIRRHPTRFEPWRLGGGRTRARTWDPMIKSLKFILINQGLECKFVEFEAQRYQCVTIEM